MALMSGIASWWPAWRDGLKTSTPSTEKRTSRSLNVVHRRGSGEIYRPRAQGRLGAPRGPHREAHPAADLAADPAADPAVALAVGLAVGLAVTVSLGEVFMTLR